MDLRSVVIGVALWLIAAYLLAKLFQSFDIGEHRRDAVKRAKSVVLWHASENVAPLMIDFPYNYKDCVFLGKWVDYIVFDGLYEWDLREIIMVEIKTWRSGLNRNEKMIKSLVAAWSVSYEILRMNP